MRLRAGFPDEVAQVDLDDLGDLAAEPTAEPTAAPKTSPWEFDVFQIPAHDLEHVVLGFFDGLGLVRDRVHRATIGSLIAIVRRHYSTDNPYHNFQHCVDVAHATFLMLVGVRHAVSDLECYALLLAALAHDLEHPGVNNSYLIKSKHPLAITYNDISVLENRHAACFFELVARYVAGPPPDRRQDHRRSPLSHRALTSPPLPPSAGIPRRTSSGIWSGAIPSS